MPHTETERYAVVSCHVERVLDDRCWELFSALQTRQPGGFRIAALLRPPDADAGEDAETWLERAREAETRGPLGHHTHFVGPTHARPGSAGPEHAERVRREALWLRGRGLPAELFCGGGWYMDEAVAVVLAELGYADCTATAFRPSYLAENDLSLSLARPSWLSLAGGERLLELPSTHSLGMAARAASRALPQYVHVYFHDTDLLTRRRRAALRTVLELLGRRCHPGDLTELRTRASGAPTVSFTAAMQGAAPVRA
jgi:hypothetical protein